MADVLSQKQIDELLNSFNTQGSKAFEEIEEQGSEKKIKNYDFKSPKKFTKEQLKVIDSIFENYSRVLSSYLTGLMRLYCRVEVMQIEEQRYYEFNNALPDYVMMSLVNMGVHDEDVMETNCIMQISNPITFTVIDRLMGGLGTYSEMNRDFTEIEITLMQSIMEKMASSLKSAWSQYIDMDPVMTAIETNSRVMQSIPPDEIIILVSLEIEIKDVKNIMSFCIPAMNLESIMNKFGDRWAKSSVKENNKKETERRRNIMDSLSNSDIDVKAILCDTQVDLYDILTLQVDDIIPLNIPIDKNIQLKIGGNLWYDGKLGILSGKKAVKIDNIYKELR
ncbi:MAG: flagellar motor switch protein FliM [Oscillospiraceae bacterium]|nr:flagellar motor switch protein FliM [Oscillospiraceae bacterium]